MVDNVDNLLDKNLRASIKLVVDCRLDAIGSFRC